MCRDYYCCCAVSNLCSSCAGSIVLRYESFASTALLEGEEPRNRISHVRLRIVHQEGNDHDPRMIVRGAERSHYPRSRMTQHGSRRLQTVLLSYYCTVVVLLILLCASFRQAKLSHHIACCCERRAFLFLARARDEPQP